MAQTVQNLYMCTYSTETVLATTETTEHHTVSPSCCDAHAHAHVYVAKLWPMIRSCDASSSRGALSSTTSTPRACLVLELEVELLDDGAHLDQDLVRQQLVLLLPDAVVLGRAQVPGVGAAQRWRRRMQGSQVC